jgi:hypothetical protein
MVGLQKSDGVLGILGTGWSGLGGGHGAFLWIAGKGVVQSVHEQCDQNDDRDGNAGIQKNQ